jgi:hypothetical protein
MAFIDTSGVELDLALMASLIWICVASSSLLLLLLLLPPPMPQVKPCFFHARQPNGY